MGLDMYAFAVPSDKAVDDFHIQPESRSEEFFYWRKNNAMHGWMEQLYKNKKLAAKQEPEVFNCEYLRLTTEDLLQLKQDIEADRLTPTAGFFFGALQYDNEDRLNDLRFINQAMLQIAEGDCVYYFSWW